jgi:hypothetical protein
VVQGVGRYGYPLALTGRKTKTEALLLPDLLKELDLVQLTAFLLRNLLVNLTEVGLFRGFYSFRVCAYGYTGSANCTPLCPYGLRGG